MIFAVLILILICLALFGALFFNYKKLKEKDMENIRLQAEQKAREPIKEAEKEKLEAFQKTVRAEFENLSHKIFSEKTNQLKKDSKEQMTNLLDPLKEKIKEFESMVARHYGDEAKERFSLKEEIRKLSDISGQMNKESKQLTQALRGDTRSQGVWGEMVLNRVLEASGLREGEEYIVQGSGMNLKSHEGSHLKPDVVVRLPDGKHLIVDSKVSLTHYLEWTKAGGDEEKSQYLKLFCQSIRKHIDHLSSKNYTEASGLRSVDFVFLFFPVESALALAVTQDLDIQKTALDKSIFIVTPSTLLATLRTVSFIWQRDRENKNAAEIAKRAGLMHEKFVGFVADLKSVGAHLDKSKNCWEGAYKKLKTGRGNLLSRMEEMKTLGARSKKTASSYIEPADPEEPPQLSPPA